MGMVHKGGNAVPFHGDYHPVSIYVGDQPIFEPIDQAQDGKTLTFENTYNDVADVSVLGESTQETLTGKNLFDSSKVFSSYHYVAIGDDTYQILRGDGSGWNTILVDGISPYLKAGKYTVSINLDSFNNETSPVLECKYGTASNYVNAFARGLRKGANVVQFNVLEDGYVGFKIFDDKYAAVSNFAQVSKPQLELGSTATDYEPYCGGIPSPNPDYPQQIESIKSVELVSSNADGTKSATRTIDLQGHELRSLPDGTHDELLVHRDGTVELVQRCDASMFDPSYPVSSEWKLAAPQTIQLPSIDPLPTYHPYTVVDGNGADISARVRVIPRHTLKMIEDGGE